MKKKKIPFRIEFFGVSQVWKLNIWIVWSGLLSWLLLDGCLSGAGVANRPKWDIRKIGSRQIALFIVYLYRVTHHNFKKGFMTLEKIPSIKNSKRIIRIRSLWGRSLWAPTSWIERSSIWIEKIVSCKTIWFWTCLIKL